MTQLELDQVRELGRQALIAERERHAKIADEFARAAIGNSKPDGTRDPALYEQGIGAERVAALIRGICG